MYCSPIPFFTSVVILSRCSPLFFTDVMLCTSVIYIIMTIAVRAVMLGVGHSDVLEISILQRGTKVS